MTGNTRRALLYGKNQSTFGVYFEPMMQAISSNAASLSLDASYTTILHPAHVDDCAESVRCLVEHQDTVNSPGTFPVSDVVFEQWVKAIESQARRRKARLQGTTCILGPW